MYYDGLEFFNVNELSDIEGLPGKRLNRIPESLIKKMDCSLPASYSRGTEIRFMMNTYEGEVTLYLIPYQEDEEVHIFFGDFFVEKKTLKEGKINSLKITVPETLRQKLDIFNKKERFNKNLVRVFFSGRNIVHYCGKSVVFCDCSLPEKKDVPEKSIFFYGSSITHGVGTLSHYNCYAQTVGRLLKTDVINLGMSGSCMVEKELVDYFCENYDADLYFFELGVNMRVRYTNEEFRERVEYLVDKLRDKKLVMTTIYTNQESYNTETDKGKSQSSFSQILREIASKEKNITLLEGEEVLKTFSFLTADLIHPSEQGHLEMGQYIAEKIKDLL